MNESIEYWKNRYAETVDGNCCGSVGRLGNFKVDTVGMLAAGCLRGRGWILDVGAGPGPMAVRLRDAVTPCYYNATDPCVETKGVRFWPWQAAKECEPGSFHMVLSLDVLLHLPVYSEWVEHLDMLFRLAGRYVVIFGADFDAEPGQFAGHVLPRRFSEYITAHYPWHLAWRIPNLYPWSGDNSRDDVSFCGFFVYRRNI